MLSVFTGLMAGWVHVLLGPDHLAAVAPLAVDTPRRGWRAGLWWGIGHTTGVWIVALIALLLRGLLPLEQLSSWSERLVGVVLIGLGFWGLRRAFSRSIHTHRHRHDTVEHLHIHQHDTQGEHTKSAGHAHTHLAIGVGALHGVAGGAHFLGVLPALALPTTGAAVAYIISFGIGSIVAMASFAWLLSRFMRGRIDSGGAYRWVLGSCSTVAIGVGVIWVFVV